MWRGLTAPATKLMAETMIKALLLLGAPGVLGGFFSFFFQRVTVIAGKPSRMFHKESREAESGNRRRMACPILCVPVSLPFANPEQKSNKHY
jgi:hypothetical protein